MAFAARTLREGEGRTERNSVRLDEPVLALPRSLEATEAEIVARGQRALPVRMDLLSAEGVLAAPHRVLSEWGQIDVLVNNAILHESGYGSESPEVTAAAVAHLATSDEVLPLLGKWIYAPKLSRDLGLS